MNPSEAGKLVKALGPLGAELLTVLWRADRRLTVRQVLEEVNRGRSEPLAYTTVMTVLNRLSRRNVLRRTEEGRGFAYEAMVTDAADLAVRDVIRDHGVSAVAHFIDQCQAEPQLRSRLMKLVQADSDNT
ncbi:BlaI/MecI/CopY family transcriptional regulator [Streptomyces sp. NPDC052309]|uniref:BlaI/MecI/CopY family transcriptional regulator n=1 Tax=Streptomyces griseicoloratus TaxID=2752516 RepID=A0A926QUS7_9ACTN|nr:BlaI/MecI/CopY family transcriptional regulator [Streptomyces griseicoloratus]MBD0423412.1 BlaI/MecI/CopY family transcriptional regulator [Streptomyces griseicoloratus]